MSSGVKLLNDSDLITLLHIFPNCLCDKDINNIYKSPCFGKCTVLYSLAEHNHLNTPTWLMYH